MCVGECVFLLSGSHIVADLYKYISFHKHNGCCDSYKRGHMFDERSVQFPFIHTTYVIIKKTCRSYRLYVLSKEEEKKRKEAAEKQK